MSPSAIIDLMPKGNATQQDMLRRFSAGDPRVDGEGAFEMPTVELR